MDRALRPGRCAGDALSATTRLLLTKPLQTNRLRTRLQPIRSQLIKLPPTLIRQLQREGPGGPLQQR